ncbi:hypothetical protein LTR66_000956 [Elasticomyces elasticus]|nr:hypothetical protein LTR66_000956 [Elasticomyces elasticus]
MTPAEPIFYDAGVATGEPRLAGHRNFPRASHACQRCRAKKGKCNQQQPCSNCIKQATACVYGVKRRNGRSNINNGCAEGHGHGHGSAERSDVQDLYRQIRHSAPIEASRHPAFGLHNPADDRSVGNNSSSPRTHGSVLSGIVQPEPSQGSRTPEQPVQGFTQKRLPAHDPDVLGDVNQHTSGTEFYGTSSNYVLLNQLFSYARLHLRPRQAGSRSCREKSRLLTPTSPAEGRSTLRDTGNDQNTVLATGNLSIVNLLSAEEALIPPSRARTPPHVVEWEPLSVQHRLSQSNPSNHAHRPAVSDLSPEVNHRLRASGHHSASSYVPSRSLSRPARTVPVTSLRLAERRLESELVRSFLHNLHYLHPMLDSNAFTERCEEEMWKPDVSYEKSKERRHFVALYNIVVAVGALVAGSDTMEELSREIKVLKQSWHGALDFSQKGSFQMLSRHYFRKSRASLGDVFEACSLESAQALLLMESLYCQNSLKPHACYMYCGMAVRTALAIGLPTESMSSSVEGRKAARRTWWCIYSHEMYVEQDASNQQADEPGHSDMCCSSGRRDSLGKPHNYPVPFPQLKGQDSGAATSEDEDYGVAMVTEMVHFAVLLRRISKEIYHNPKGLTMPQKSSVAIELDALLIAWKSKLPEGLNFDVVSFREAEWAAKQKLVLHLRYLNARVILHRPFLADLTSEGESNRQKHVDLCLDAARKTIRLLYDSYANRHYFRTWWYNPTYTLYAGMIVLYVIMLGHTTIPSNDLVDDVKKSRDILRSMEEASVARRSADLMSEVLDVAREYTQRQHSAGPDRFQDMPMANEHQDQTQPHEKPHHTNDGISCTLFPYTDLGQDPGDLLASLTDPNMLQDFTAEGGDFMDLDFAFPPAYGNFDCSLDGEDNLLAATSSEWQCVGGTDHAGEVLQ